MMLEIDDPNEIERVFRWATVIFACALSLHAADHLRRGMDVVPRAVMIGGTVQLMLAAITVVLVFAGSRAAPYFAVGVGSLSAIGFTVAHLLPTWGFFSDSFINAPPAARVTWFSWVTAVVEILADVMFAIVGAVVLRSRRGTAESGPRQESSRLIS
ncbi:hypothetical protein [Gordonia insulae]|uniref:Uncharacterized protein n=1 Tax=Gordonia insulae TaxID=2420509 RepID=A0A3G8JQI9_9ACTN|nr:hypothetical protein [Gordonia insulae]AZG46985.1 hypothetical protein D7316_03590 [Gordonia insulae]